MMLEHPKIVPRSRKTLDFSRVGVAWGGSAFHHVVALVQVVVEMYKRPEGGSGGAQGGSLEGAKRELREAARGQLEVASSSRGGRSSSSFSSSSSSIAQEVAPLVLPLSLSLSLSLHHAASSSRLLATRRVLEVPDLRVYYYYYYYFTFKTSHHGAVSPPGL